MSNSSVSWRLDDGEAQLSCGPLKANLVLDSLGVRFLPRTWEGGSAEKFGAFITSGPACKASPEVEIIDRYVRGPDVVVTYAKIAPYQVSPQIYWRANELPESSAVRVEMILSMQTDLLDSEPGSSVDSFGTDATIYHADGLSASRFHVICTPRGANSPETAIQSVMRAQSAEHIFVFRNDSIGLSYAQMVHPTDFVSSEIFAGRDLQPFLITSKLFPERLEKGVIRRARICGWFMPAEKDLETAVELAKRFVDEPLPLTT